MSSGWPGRHRRSPRIWERSYLMHRPLSDGLKREVNRLAADRSLGVVVDVGCGEKPYLPWFEGRCERYLGIDLGGAADVIGTTDALPLKDGVADLVLSTQVLEHVPDPSATVREIARVLRPGGVALMSTHGVYPFHPTPTDYWRWTGQGLEKLVMDTGSFRSVKVHSCGGTFGCLSYLGALYSSLVAERLRRRGGPAAVPLTLPFRAITTAFNLAGRSLDRLAPAAADHTKDAALIANFLVVANR